MEAVRVESEANNVTTVTLYVVRFGHQRHFSQG